MNASVEAVNVDSSEFLTFTLGAEEYGVDILKVQEIRRYDTVTRIPDTPDFIKGVVNLRGTIVPVIDLRQKLKFERADYDAFTVMIILNIAKRVVGMVRSEEHTSELQSLMRISYAVFCLKQKQNNHTYITLSK